MFKWLGGLIDSNDKVINKLKSKIDRINALEPEFQKLSDDDLKAKTAEFKARIKEATLGINMHLDGTRKELEEARQRLNQAANELARDEASREVKSVQSHVDDLEKKRVEAENDILDELLPEAFAVVREASRRTIGMRHFDVQLIGGIILHQGRIAEMKTGEGKTLVATLPLYLNSLTGKGCHLVTVNDYLARRDPYWMGPVYHALGVSVSSIYPMQTPDEYAPARLYDPSADSGDPRWKQFRTISRKEAYQADITYGTSTEFGFDYLRDNMVVDISQGVQRELNYSIVDEVDYLLIDEARTPLIISAPAPRNFGQLYKLVNDVVSRMNGKVLPHQQVRSDEKEAETSELEKGFDYIAYEKERYVQETVRGQEKLAKAFGLKAEDLFGSETLEAEQNVTPEEAEKRTQIRSIFHNSMTAHALFHRDRNYVIDQDTDGQKGIVIVDEFTGRKMFGRRYEDGLHQALEAKENLGVRQETLTFATITIQNYFRLYQKLAGMTGTAETEAEEFYKIYKLDVVKIPTHQPMIREDEPEQIYKTEAAKFKAVVGEVKELHKLQRPVLIGTVSVEKSVQLSDMLRRQGMPNQVLNAKEHTREGEIIAKAGEPGTVTVATNMAGRGVDIILGGKKPEKPDDTSPEAIKKFEKEISDWEKRNKLVKELGGLHVIGTEHHEARRIDNQLKGRAGRQGDTGSSRFYASLEDDIMRRFGGDRVKSIMEWAGMDEETPLENSLVSRMITDAQKRVEGYNFDIRKNLVEYDDVVNTQRKIIYDERHKILSGADLKANMLEMITNEIKAAVSERSPALGEEWDMKALLGGVTAIFPVAANFNPNKPSPMKPKQVEEELITEANTFYEEKEKQVGPENMRVMERLVMLRVIDSLWVNHLTRMDEMRLQAGWEAVRERRSIDSYKRDGYQQFQTLLATIRHDVANTIYHVTIQKREAQAQKPAPSPLAQAAARSASAVKPPANAGGKKAGRNDPCPCGSGKKYKHCCGK